jgi:hypothetical protein
MSGLDVQRDWAVLQAHLPADYERLATECGALRPHYPNVRIETADELLRLILLHVGANLPLRQTVALIAESGGPAVSPYCLHMHMRTAGGYLGRLVAQMTRWRKECEPDEWRGYELVAVDGSSFAGRRANGTDARIHAALRLSDLAVLEAVALGVESGESLKRFGWMPGQLAIGDRGYCNAPGIAWTLDQGADVLVRLNRGALPLFDEHGKSIDVLAWVRSMDEDTIVERAVLIDAVVDGHRRIIAGRLTASRLPEDKADEARARLRKEQGSSVTAESLEMASYVVLFTTVPATRLSASWCMKAYRLRWQVELLFKRWKSLCGFDRLPNERADTVVTWLTAKLLLGLMVDRIAAQVVPPLSPPQSSPCAARRARRADGARPLEGHGHRLARNRRRAATAPSASDPDEAGRHLPPAGKL